jgi:hypothetical protein
VHLPSPPPPYLHFLLLLLLLFAVTTTTTTTTHRLTHGYLDGIQPHRLSWFGPVQEMEEGRIPRRVLYMNLETTRLTGRPRNRWQDEVRENGRIVCEVWQEEAYNREE